MTEFKNPGHAPGLEVWRIENKQATPVDKKEYGVFYSGDSYIVLHTYTKKNKLNWDLHFWLGSSTEQAEAGIAAYKTVELDDLLGGAPVQHREVQGHESEAFLSLFKDLGGVRVLDGGVASGFHHVEATHYEPRLLHVKGKRSVRVSQVPLTTDSMNDGDVFILDAGLTLYQWNGPHANKYEKYKALETSTAIKNERGAKAQVVVLEGGKNDDDAAFWKILGGKKAIKSGDSKSDDEVKGGELKMFRVSDASGSLTFSEAASGKLERKLLDTNDAFIVDSGSNIFVWVGKGANPNERKNAMITAQKYLEQSHRPNFTSVTRVIEGGEPVAFTSLFVQWEPPKIVSFDPAAPAPAPVDDPIDAAALHAYKAAEEKMITTHSGKVKVWKIENFEKIPVPEDKYGQFYDGDSFIVLYSYKNARNKDQSIIYFWQGRESTADEKGTAAYMAVQMDTEMGGDPVQVRVVQNKEPDLFLSLFKGKMVVHKGGAAAGFKNSEAGDSYDTDGISLFHIRGTNEINTRAVQVQETASSLNSGDSFVLLAPHTMYVWFGQGANANERACAVAIAKTLQGSRTLEELDEGNEPDQFWTYLGGKGDYPRSKELASAVVQPRLFHCSDVSGKFKVEEISNFAQEDLTNDDVYILDAYSEVFVWIGKDARENEKKKGLDLALEYVNTASDGRSGTCVYKVLAGEEPPIFTCHFLGWNDALASDFSDPYLKKLEAMAKSGNVHKGPSYAEPYASGSAAESKVEKKAVKVDAAAHHAAAAGPTAKFSVDDLKSNNIPASVDKSKKELYLSDTDFQQVFHMSPAAFAAQPKWKQDNQKKAAGLF